MLNNSLLSVDEFRSALGHKVGRNFVYRALCKEEGGIKHIRTGRKILILASEVNDWPLRESKKLADKKLEGEV